MRLSVSNVIRLDSRYDLNQLLGNQTARWCCHCQPRKKFEKCKHPIRSRLKVFCESIYGIVSILHIFTCSVCVIASMESSLILLFIMQSLGTGWDNFVCGWKFFNRIKSDSFCWLWPERLDDSITFYYCRRFIRSGILSRPVEQYFGARKALSYGFL